MKRGKSFVMLFLLQVVALSTIGTLAAADEPEAIHFKKFTLDKKFPPSVKPAPYWTPARDAVKWDSVGTWTPLGLSL